MSWKGPKVGIGMLDFVEELFTVDTIWNIGETGDIYFVLRLPVLVLLAWSSVRPFLVYSEDI